MEKTKANVDAFSTEVDEIKKYILDRSIKKIDEIGRKTYKLKKKESAFYAEALKESRRSTKFVGTNKLRKMAYEKFGQEWKKIDDGKDEVNWMIHRLYTSIEGEEEKK